MKTKLLVLAVSCLAVVGSAMGQPPSPPENRIGMNRFPMISRELKLTDQQKSQAQKIKFDLMQKQIDIRAQIAHDRVDYKQLAAAENPDESQLMAKVQDIAKLKGELHENLLDAWFSINKILDPTQQKIWKRVLEDPMSFGRGMQMSRMHNRMMMRDGALMRGSPMMGHGGMMMGGNGPMGVSRWQEKQTKPDTTQ